MYKLKLWIPVGFNKVTYEGMLRLRTEYDCDGTAILKEVNG